MRGFVGRRRVLGIVCSLALLSACGGGDESAEGGFDSPDACVDALVDVSDGDVTAAELVERCGVSVADAEAAIPERQDEEDDPEPVEETTTTTTTAPTTTTTAAPEPTEVAGAEPAAVMPDIRCGTDLQLAQDLVQEAGVFLSQSVDATGQDRNQVMDRNWTVVRSEPPAGTPIEEDVPVFYVVKDEEFTSC